MKASAEQVRLAKPSINLSELLPIYIHRGQERGGSGGGLGAGGGAGREGALARSVVVDELLDADELLDDLDVEAVVRVEVLQHHEVSSPS